MKTITVRDYIAFVRDTAKLRVSPEDQHAIDLVKFKYSCNDRDTHFV